LDWSEMTRFANESTMDAIRQRKNIDPKFRTFMATNLRREMQEQPVGDGVTPEGQVPEVRGSQPSLYLIEFARKYAKEPVANLRFFVKAFQSINQFAFVVEIEKNFTIFVALHKNLLNRYRRFRSPGRTTGPLACCTTGFGTC